MPCVVGSAVGDASLHLVVAKNDNGWRTRIVVLVQLVQDVGDALAGLDLESEAVPWIPAVNLGCVDNKYDKRFSHGIVQFLQEGTLLEDIVFHCDFGTSGKKRQDILHVLGISEHCV